MGKVFNKGLDKDGEKGLLKRLKNIEDNNQEQLKAIKGKTGLKSQIDLFEKELSSKAVTLLKEIKEIKDNVDYDKLFFTGGNKKVHHIKKFKTLEKLTNDIYKRNTKTDEAEIKQNEFFEELRKLKDYPARGPKHIDLKESVSKNTNKFYDGWKKIVYGFKNGILPLSKKGGMKTDSADQQPSISDTREQRRFDYFFTAN